MPRLHVSQTRMQTQPHAWLLAMSHRRCTTCSRDTKPSKDVPLQTCGRQGQINLLASLFALANLTLHNTRTRLIGASLCVWIRHAKGTGTIPEPSWATSQPLGPPARLCVKKIQCAASAMDVRIDQTKSKGRYAIGQVASFELTSLHTLALADCAGWLLSVKICSAFAHGTDRVLPAWSLREIQ